MSFQAEKRYINKSNGRVKINMLAKDSVNIPKRLRNFQSFKKIFDNKRHYEYIFKGFKLLIDVSYAFEHFKKNTYNEDRSNLNGTLYDVLYDPLIVIIDGKREVLTFYKPYKNDDNLYHMVMYQAKRGNNNIFRFKTIYSSSSILKIDKIIKTPDMNTIYFKYNE